METPGPQEKFWDPYLLGISLFLLIIFGIGFYVFLRRGL